MAEIYIFLYIYNTEKINRFVNDNVSREHHNAHLDANRIITETYFSHIFNALQEIFPT